MLQRNIKLVFSTNALMLGSGVITSLLSAWALGPTGRGDLMVVLMWPAIFSMVAQIGLPQAYRFWIARRPECASALFSNAVIFTLVAGLITLALAELVIPQLIGVRSPEVLRLTRIYLLVIPVHLLTDLTRGLLEGARRFTWVGALRLILFGVQLVSYVVLWMMGTLTVATASYTMLVSLAASLVVSLIAVWRELSPKWNPNLSELGTTLRYGIRDYPGILTEFVNWRLDLMMLVGTASSAALGLYVVALRLADITSTLAGSVGDALLPEVAASKQADEATRVVTRSLRLTLCAHLLILVPLWIAAPYILRFAYGEGFVEVTNVLRLLMFASVVWSAGAIVISGLNGLGHPGLSAIARIAAAVVMVVALLTLLPRRGIQGAALSSILGYSVMFLVALFWLLRRRQITLWECLRPRWDDVPMSFTPVGLRVQFAKFLGRTPHPDSQTADALAGLE
ncbi:MAG TPA: polysaccharide biosynthesis C-terminal domain-containing protein [Pyrinomonadaceae bacterium]|jgi:O-antigen/teichoic acid export membrane protein|nr:polysaccharide biosynthesis C-terminal domain-containing protein [Pyrinomonadaceae bacterium]